MQILISRILRQHAPPPPPPHTHARARTRRIQAQQRCSSADDAPKKTFVLLTQASAETGHMPTYSDAGCACALRSRRCRRACGPSMPCQAAVLDSALVLVTVIHPTGLRPPPICRLHPCKRQLLYYSSLRIRIAQARRRCVYGFGGCSLAAISHMCH